MGLEGYSNEEYKKPNVSCKDHCQKRKCFFYIDRIKNAMLMAALNGQAGVWDFAKCYHFCPHKVEDNERRRLVQRVYRRNNRARMSELQRKYRRERRERKACLNEI